MKAPPHPHNFSTTENHELSRVRTAAPRIRRRGGGGGGSVVVRPSTLAGMKGAVLFLARKSLYLLCKFILYVYKGGDFLKFVTHATVEMATAAAAYTQELRQFK